MSCKIKAELETSSSSVDRLNFLNSVVRLSVETDCDYVRKLVENLKEFKVIDLFKLFTNNPVYVEASKTIKHSTCPVPSAILKVIEAEAGLATKKNIKMEFI